MNFAGKPLIAWTIERAMESHLLTDVVVTTDSEDICEIARQWGARAPFLRPAELATDDSNINDALIHALGFLKEREGREYDYLVLLQPTQPLRPVGFVDESLDYYFRYRRSEVNNLVTIFAAENKMAYLMEQSPEGFVQFLLVRPQNSVNRQSLPVFFFPAGLFYLAPVGKYLRDRNFYSPDAIGMPVSKELCADIDTRADFDSALSLYESLSKQV